MPVLPAPPPDTPATRDRLVAWVDEHLGHLACDTPRPSGIRGGQAAADAALSALDLTGYARRRSQVLPAPTRGASRMSPYVRHGLLTLPQLWSAAAAAPPADRTKYRDELLWQEYARHLYARLGAATRASMRTEPPVVGVADPWPREMACMDVVLTELEDDGWLVNQTRMWLASQWTVRGGRDWRKGEDRLYRHLLDGSRAANRLGWQWTTGAGSGKPYGFSRWQVEKRAPGLCGTCPLQRACPVQGWPDATAGPRVPEPAGLRGGPTDAGPAQALLRRLRLSGKRLVFLAAALAELDCEVRLGDPVVELAGRRLAVTFAPVPGFRRRSAALDVVALHPWPWLRRPTAGSLRSFSAWR